MIGELAVRRAGQAVWMPSLRSVSLLLLVGFLAGCGGLNRAVAVLPEATDDLARKTEPFRRDRAAAPERVAPPSGGF